MNQTHPVLAMSGDLGDYIFAELNGRGGRGIPLVKSVGLPKIPATWEIVRVEVAGVLCEVGVGVDRELRSQKIP